MFSYQFVHSEQLLSSSFMDIVGLSATGREHLIRTRLI